MDRKIGGKRTLMQDKTETAEPPSKMKDPSIAEEQDNKVKWQYLEHHGILFPELYTPIGFKLKMKVEFNCKGRVRKKS